MNSAKKRCVKGVHACDICVKAYYATCTKQRLEAVKRDCLVSDACWKMANVMSDNALLLRQQFALFSALSHESIALIRLKLAGASITARRSTTIAGMLHMRGMRC